MRARALVGPYALVWFYRRWLRMHAAQELLAGVGVAISVALVFATIVAAGSIAGSAGQVVHAVVGPASLQLHARGPDGFSEDVLSEVEALPGVRQAAPLLEQTATLNGPDGRHIAVDLAGADTSLVVLDGLAHTIPRQTLSTHEIGLSSVSAGAIGARRGSTVDLRMDGVAQRLPVSAVLGREAFGALSEAAVAVMPLSELQRLSGMEGRISRVLVEPATGRREAVRAELSRLAGGGIEVASATADVKLLRQALRPSDEASGFFAAISALLGLLLAAGALLLTAPERRRAIAELRLIGTKRSAIGQMFLFQALLLGLLASLLGLAIGYALSPILFHETPRYLAEAFTLGTQTIVSSGPLLIALCAGVLATCIASALPLLDMRGGGAIDAIYEENGVPGNMLGRRARRRFGACATVFVAAASILFATHPSLALPACALLALATVMLTPLTLASVMCAGRAIVEARQRLTVLPVALSSLRTTTLRSLALSATGAVALFGSVSLGGARGDLVDGINGFARSYSADAAVWVGTPGDNQAVVSFASPDGLTARLARLRGVSRVSSFAGGFAQLHGRRVWLIARPPGGAAHVLASQLSGGGPLSAGDPASASGPASASAGAPASVERRLAEGGWIVVSQQIAEERDIRVGGALTLPTPSGPHRFRVAAFSTNLAWSPGVVFLSLADWRALWHSDAPTALALRLRPGASASRVREEAQQALGGQSGLVATTARERERSIDALTSEGLRQLGEISTLLLLAAVLAMAAALTSSIWQRRAALAGLRLSGVSPGRLRRILMTESALMLGAGCVTGALMGVYGEAVIDRYLAHVTGFPIASVTTSARPIEILALVVIVVLCLAAVPALLASRVSPRVAFSE